MASEIRVNKIINRSGLSTVTFTSDGAIVSGIVSATVYTGSGANLTDLPAGNLSGTLPAISATNLTNVPAANITGTLPAISATNLTNVPAANITGTLPAIDGSNLTGINAGVGTQGSVNTSGIITATAFVPTTGQLSHRNLIINGDMRIAQRATTSNAVGYVTIDRFSTDYGGENEAMSYSQADISSGSPYEAGFAKAFKVQNGNQTSGAGAGDYVYVRTKLEAQDIATSGWNFKSASSFITLSFWVKSSVAQNFYCRLETADGTAQNFPFETGSLTADTWTKITKAIPGNSNLQFDYNNDPGIEIHWDIFRGTNFTNNSVSNDTWAAYASGTRTKDNTSTWWTTNNATYEITGVQLEVGSVATPFEHRSQTEELNRCKRYFQKFAAYSDHYFFGISRAEGGSIARTGINIPIPMRAAPTVACPGNRAFKDGTNYTSTSTPSILAASNWISEAAMYTIDFGGHSGLTHNNIYLLMSSATAALGLTLDSEL